MCGNETRSTNIFRKKVSIIVDIFVNEFPPERSLIRFVQLPVFDGILMERIYFPLCFISLLSLTRPEMLFGLK